MAKEFNKSAGRNRFYGIAVIRPWNDMGTDWNLWPWQRHGRIHDQEQHKHIVQCAGCIILIEIKMQRLFFKYLEASPPIKNS